MLSTALGFPPTILILGHNVRDTRGERERGREREMERGREREREREIERG